MARVKAETAGTPAPAAATATVKPKDLVLSPSVQSAIGLIAWSKYAGAGESDLADMVTELRSQIREVQDGDMGRPEAILYSQAVVLGSIFTSLIRRAANQDQLKQYQVHMSLALKAQAQSRATLEALADIKNPRQVAFVGQANIAHQQQINNGAASETGAVRAGVQARAGQTSTVQNEVLEPPHGNVLDIRTASPTGGADRQVEAVGTGHGPANGGG